MAAFDSFVSIPRTSNPIVIVIINIIMIIIIIIIPPLVSTAADKKKPFKLAFSLSELYFRMLCPQYKDGYAERIKVDMARCFRENRIAETFRDDWPSRNRQKKVNKKKSLA